MKTISSTLLFSKLKSSESNKDCIQKGGFTNLLQEKYIFKANKILKTIINKQDQKGLG